MESVDSDNVDEVVEEIKFQLTDLQRELDLMRSENETFEHFFETKTAGNTTLLEEIMKKPSQRKNRSVPSVLSSEQKAEIVSFTLDELQVKAKASQKQTEKLLDSLRAVLEETDLRIAELKKDAYEFKREIVVGAENTRTGKTLAEKVLRYMDGKLKQKDQVVEKLRLKNAGLKAGIVKAERLFNQKEEMGDILHYIDFHQLQIENEQQVLKIDDLNTDLFKLKLTTARTIKSLSRVKQQLEDQVIESSRIGRDTAIRSEQLARVHGENEHLQDEVQNEKRTQKKLTQEKKDNTDLPQILDYVAQKAEEAQLTDAIRNWKKKVELMEVQAAKARRRRQPRIVGPSS